MQMYGSCLSLGQLPMSARSYQTLSRGQTLQPLRTIQFNWTCQFLIMFYIEQGPVCTIIDIECSKISCSRHSRTRTKIDVSELYACRDLTTDRPLACIINRHDVIKISPQTLHPKQLQIMPMVQQWWVILVVTAVSRRKSSPRLA